MEFYKIVIIVISLQASPLLSFAENRCIKTNGNEIYPVDERHCNLIDDSVKIASVTQDNVIRDYVTKEIASFKLSTLSFADKEPGPKALREWYQNIVSLNRVAFEKIKGLNFLNDSAAERIATSIVMNTISGWITNAAKTTLHERGHTESAQNANANKTWYSTQNSNKKINMGKLFINLLSGQREAKAHYESNSEFSPKQSAAFSAAGLNQQLIFAEDIANQSVESGQFHSSDYVHYLINKFSTPLYHKTTTPGKYNDLESFADDFVKQNIISKDEAQKFQKKVAAYSLYSALLSGRTWEGLKANIDYITKGKSTADTIRFNTPFGTISWPEFTTFLNEDSISIKGSTSILTDKLKKIDLSVEQTIIGKSITEVSALYTFILGKNKRSDMTVGGSINSDGGYALDALLKYDISGKGKWFVFAGGSYNSGGTMKQKRELCNNCSTENAKDEVRGNIGISASYHGIVNICNSLIK